MVDSCFQLNKDPGDAESNLMMKVPLGSYALPQLAVFSVAYLAEIQDLQMFVEPKAATAAVHTLTGT